MSPTRSIDVQSDGSKDSSVKSEHARRTMTLASEEERLNVRKDIERIVKSASKKKIKPKVRQVTWLERVSHRSVTRRGTVSYLTDGATRVKEAPVKGYMRPTEKWKYKEDIRERVKVKDLPTPKSLIDTIPDYYTVTRGRPNKEKFIKNDFVAQSRFRLLQNLEQGFLCDVIKHMEELTIIQTSVLEGGLQESRNMRKLMDLFLADQLKEAVKIEDNLKQVRDVNELLDIELKEINKKVGTLKDTIHRKSVEIDNAMQYKKFLHRISSREWLEQYEKEKLIWREENTSNVDNLIEKIVSYKKCGEDDTSMDDVLIKFVKVYENCGPVKIEFNNLKEVTDLMKSMYLGNLERASMIKELKRQAGPIVKDGRRVDTKLRNYVKQLDRVIKTTAEDTEHMKASEQRLNSMYRDIKKMCKQLIVSKEVLKNLALLKEFYEEMTGNNSDFKSEEDMWREIDEVYTELKEKIKKIPPAQLKLKYKAIKKQQEGQMKNAEKAKDRVIQVESMIRGIRKSYEKPLGEAKKPLLPRSVPPPESPPTPTPPSTPGASYHEELDKEKTLYYPMKHLKELYEMKVKTPPLDDMKTVVKREKAEIVEDEINRFMYSIPRSESSTESSASSIDSTILDPTLKLIPIDPVKEFVDKELNVLKTLPNFNELVAAKNPKPEEQ